MVTMLFLYLIVLFTFYACKNDPNNISNPYKTKTNITIYKSLGKSKDQYIIQTACKLSRPYLYSKRSLRVLQLGKRCKSENVRKCTWRERKASYLIWIPLTFDKLYMLKTLCMQNKLLNSYRDVKVSKSAPISFSPQKTIWSILLC